MRTLLTALELVYSRPSYVVGGVVTALVAAVLYVYTATGSLALDPDPTHLAAIAALALLTGLALPVQVYGMRRAAWSVRQGGTGVLGIIGGIGSLGCCSPLLVPAVLSFAGFSGASLLTVNATLYRYFAPLALLGLGLLTLSLYLAARDVTRACTVNPHGASLHTSRPQVRRKDLTV